MADTRETNILVAIDIYSKFIWAWTFSTPGSAATTITAFEDLRRRYTLPKCVYTDNVSSFVNQAVSTYLGRYGLSMESASPYSPVGIVESAR
jgi:transposase InsO family protein